jgi:hypothetical protein
VRLSRGAVNKQTTESPQTAARDSFSHQRGMCIDAKIRHKALNLKLSAKPGNQENMKYTSQSIDCKPVKIICKAFRREKRL